MKGNPHTSNPHPLAFVIDALADLGRAMQEIREKQPEETTLKNPTKSTERTSATQKDEH
ncbi:MAG: hypothetical protein HUU38_11755 [Anaerolineales bacterium]|nr:hypothetical protein [Anaerolineales bacterium]